MPLIEPDIDKTLTHKTTSSRKGWHFVPDIPLRQAPYFETPFSLKDSVLYLLNIWRPFKQRFLLLILAIIVWVWFTPAIERTAEFKLDWMLEIGLRNLVIVLVVAGGLHLLLYMRRDQGDDEHYDARPMGRKSRLFHFGNQVWDNMFWTLFSSVPIGTLWECLILWSYANGHATLMTFAESPGWFIGWMLILPIWSGFHFYGYHRLLHFEPLYRWFHSWHHKNINTGPWSGHAMHPVEHIFLYSDLIIYFLVASHPIHVIFNAMLHTVAGPTSHCGYHRVRFGRFFSLQLGDFMHQLHHRYFDCNYGSYETPWDKFFGSFHDGTVEGDAFIKERRKKMFEKKNLSV
ncbi:MAG: lathosterol oxidase [Gammaproteobacteria bacterium]|jgi:lathosterol oxidase